jgi:ketosteroid isomerase-like protein
LICVTSSHAVEDRLEDRPKDRLKAAEFVKRFEQAWARSSADAIVELLTEDVVLKQPSLPDTVGKDAAHKAFTRVFRAFPGLTATVHRWAADGDLVFIEFTLSGEFGGRRLSWPAVDRFFLREGLIAERVNYADGGQLFMEILKRPRGWRRLIRSGLRPRLS